MRRDAKADANQPEIVQALQAVGCTVQHLHMVGEGVPDLMVGFRGETYLIEIKTETGQLNKREAKWHQWWKGQPVHIIRSVMAALQLVGFGT